jgi:hypothetical protein
MGPLRETREIADQNERPVPVGDGRACTEGPDTRKGPLFTNPAAGARRFEPNNTARPPMAMGESQNGSRPAFVANRSIPCPPTALPSG